MNQDFDMEKSDEVTAQIEADNDQLLKMFGKHLLENGITEKTKNRHIGNVNLYLNIFLTRQAHTMNDGCGHLIQDFLGDYYIYECTGTTPTTLKQTASSIRIFYQYCAESGRVSLEEYKNLAAIMKVYLPYWLASADKYHDQKIK